MSQTLDAAIALLTAATGTAVLGRLGLESSPTAARVIGIAAIALGLLAALRGGIGLEERGARHREAAVGYGALRRRLEQAQLGTESEVAAEIDRIRSEWDDLDKTAPPTASRLYTRAVEKVLKENG